ncbi:Protein of unknown function (DUF3109) [Belliella baltica DSM 15883]|uniref:DUF3109 family protein n=1 Tax=Belliella baltica (strain DSM 15883 / CIP 108006 / LMG 21964 / BA134) TaxID=866536 RepID=I3Z9U4_BELBD|nr:DUF3109 family protein [Belliella baltica]AFL86012.1 Protein of unknown function (DUF3109) [Belliella baltica DSM 15883]
MILVGNAVISDDIKEQFFVCDLEKCKGACCVEGDAGAPLEDEETQIIEEIYPIVKDYITQEGRDAVERQGTWVIDKDGDKGTPTIGDNRECAYALYDEKGILKCGIEQAYLDGKIAYKKPISCHLYPIRVKKYDDFEALNYDRWDICSAACVLGSKLGVPIYKFLKDALIRKFGEDWYAELVEEIEGGESKEEIKIG